MLSMQKMQKPEAIFYIKKTLNVHLLQSRFIPSYNCWTLHRELGVAMQEDEEEDDNIPDWTQYDGFAENTTGEVDGAIEKK